MLLCALGAAGVRSLGIFNNTEFLMLTFIGMAQATVAILINARTSTAGPSVSAMTVSEAEKNYFLIEPRRHSRGFRNLVLRRFNFGSLLAFD